jgi:hypothetical protein
MMTDRLESHRQLLLPLIIAEQSELITCPFDATIETDEQESITDTLPAPNIDEHLELIKQLLTPPIALLLSEFVAIRID